MIRGTSERELSFPFVPSMTLTFFMTRTELMEPVRYTRNTFSVLNDLLLCEPSWDPRDTPPSTKLCFDTPSPDTTSDLRYTSTIRRSSRRLPPYVSTFAYSLQAAGANMPRIARRSRPSCCPQVATSGTLKRYMVRS